MICVLNALVLKYIERKIIVLFLKDIAKINGQDAIIKNWMKSMMKLTWMKIK